MIGEYMFGNNDFLDAQLPRFVALTDSRVCDIVRQEPDDEAAAKWILAKARTSAADCDNFNRAFMRWNAPSLAMIDAGENRMRGRDAAFLKAIYNGIMVLPATLAFRFAGRRARA